MAKHNLSEKHGGKVLRVRSQGRWKVLKTYCRIYATRPQHPKRLSICSGLHGAAPCPDLEACMLNAPPPKWKPDS